MGKQAYDRDYEMAKSQAMMVKWRREHGYPPRKMAEPTSEVMRSVMSRMDALEDRAREVGKIMAELPVEPEERVVIKVWPSHTNPKKSYELTQGRDGIIYCTCPAWKFSKEEPKSCKHMVAWADLVAKNGIGLK